MSKKFGIALLVITILLVAFISLGMSYALWKMDLVQEEVNVVTAGCFEVSLSNEAGAIHLDNALPISDEEGLALAPYTFTLTNVCETDAAYSIYLEMLEGTTMSSYNVDYDLNNKGVRILGYMDSAPSKESTSVASRVIDTGYLVAGATKDFNLKLWMDKATTLEQGANKVLNAKVVVVNQATTFKTLCKKATTLHTETCNNEMNASQFCQGDGYALGDTVTFGKIPGNTLEAGAAFDCDVNGDGTYDSETERFYYVTDLDPDTAVLAYYNNVHNGEPEKNFTYKYSPSNAFVGPVSTLEHLPTIFQWKKVKLVNTAKYIKDEKGRTIVGGFNYYQKAARIVTYREAKACVGKDPHYTGAYKTDCNFFLENTKYTDSTAKATAVWIDAPYSGATVSAWGVWSTHRSLNYYGVTNVGDVGIRPVIEVNKELIKFSE